MVPQCGQHTFAFGANSIVLRPDRGAGGLAPPLTCRQTSSLRDGGLRPRRPVKGRRLLCVTCAHPAEHVVGGLAAVVAGERLPRCLVAWLPRYFHAPVVTTKTSEYLATGRSLSR